MKFIITILLLIQAFQAFAQGKEANEYYKIDLARFQKIEMSNHDPINFPEMLLGRTVGTGSGCGNEGHSSIDPIPNELSFMGSIFLKVCTPTSKMSDIKRNSINISEVDQPSEEDLLLIYRDLKPHQICGCLKDKPLDQSLLHPKFQKKPAEEIINSAIANNLKDTYGQLLKSVTLFKNLNLKGELHHEAQSLCKLDPNMLQPLGCDSTESDIQGKLKLIFGETELGRVESKVSDELSGLGNGRCLSKFDYHFLQATEKAAAKISTQLESELNTAYQNYDGPPRRTRFPLTDTDIFYRLSSQDLKFKAEIMDWVKAQKDPKEAYYRLNIDEEPLKIAFHSIASQCESFTKNLATFICSKNTPPLTPQATSFILGEAIKPDPISDELTNEDSRKAIDFYTDTFACKNSTPINTQIQGFSDYLAKSAINKVYAREDQSDDYQDFNKTFCPGVEGRISKDNLDDVLKKYLQDKDLTSFFSQDSISQILKVKIDVTKSPAVESLDGKSFPEITKFAWLKVAKTLIAQNKLTKAEATQLYSLIQMQTNLRIKEANEYREKIILDHPELSGISPIEVDSLIRGDSAAITQLSTRYPQISSVASEVQTTIKTQEKLREERFGIAQSSSESSRSLVVNVPVTNPTSSGQTTKVETPTATTVVQSTGTTTTGFSSNLTDIRDPGPITTPIGGQTTPIIKPTTKTTTPINSTTDFSAEIKRMRDELTKSREEISNMWGNSTRKGSNTVSNNTSGNNNASSFTRNNGGSVSSTTSNLSNNSDYNFPRNLPVKKEDGKYYYPPQSKGSELSSAKGTKNAGSSKAGSPANGDESSLAAAAANFSGGTGGLNSKNGRKPASLSGNKLLNLATFEYPHFIPQSFFDIVGSIERVVILLSLEGKAFKSIEAIEEFDEKGNGKIKYYQRTYDFVPKNQFQKFKDIFASSEKRSENFNNFFGYPRNKENLELSKKYASATKEIIKEEVEHSYVLEIQDYILSDTELKASMKDFMDKIE